jgi:hypothetical protein
MAKREYPLKIRVNNTFIDKVIIDSHYEEKHSESISDKIILALVKTLDGNFYEPEVIKGKYNYFVTDKVWLNNKRYKLIWLLEDNEIYIGVINAYRR